MFTRDKEEPGTFRGSIKLGQGRDETRKNWSSIDEGQGRTGAA